MLHIINEILDLSKIEAGHVHIYMEQVKLDSLIDDVISVTKPLLDSNNNRLNLNISSDQDTLYTDVIKFRQILYNLISNASKFTEHGEIKVDIRAENCQLNICISDTGIGMSQDQIDNLFKPFSQGDASTTRKYGGTGLGLTITKQYCEMMNGTISVSSHPGMGSTFTVTLPFDSDESTNNSQLQTMAS